MQEGDFDATILGESGQSDPDDFLYDVFYTGGGGNFGEYASPRTRCAVRTGTPAPATRRSAGASMRRAQALVLEEAPHVFLFLSTPRSTRRSSLT